MKQCLGFFVDIVINAGTIDQSLKKNVCKYVDYT